MSSNIMRDETGKKCEGGHREHLFPSLVLFPSYTLLGALISILGPAVPSLARDMDVRETDFGETFFARGLGYFLGSWSTSITLPGIRDGRLQRVFNNRMYRLGFFTAGMGIFTLAMSNSPTLSWICAYGFLQGFCGGMVDTTSNITISSLHGAGVAPWMQGLHLSFSLGALIAPAAVGQFGYRIAFLFLGLLGLSLPSGLVCFLTAAEGCRNEHCNGHLPALELEQHVRTDPDTMKEVGLVAENNRFFKTSQEPAIGKEMQSEKCHLYQLDAFNGASTCVERRYVSESSLTPLSTSPEAELISALPISGHMTERVDENVENGHSGHTSIQIDGANPMENANSFNRVMTRELDTLGDVLTESETGRASPVLLDTLLAGVLFVYVGAEVGFGGWIAVTVLRARLASEVTAALIASLFWGGITFGRLLAIPLAVHFKTDTLMRVNLLGCLVSSILLLLVGTDNLAWVATGTGLFGLSMASIYPLVFSLLSSWGFTLSDRDASIMVVGGALGEMVLPMLIGWLSNPKNSGSPATLYAVCALASFMMVAVYVASHKFAISWYNIG